MAWTQIADAEENDETDWDIVSESGTGTLNVSAGAKKNGNYGWEVTIDGTANIARGDLTGATTETVITIELWLDPHSLTMATNDEFYAVIAEDDSQSQFPIRVALGYDGSDYYIKGCIRTDGAAISCTSAYTITDAFHLIRVIWAASTGAGNNDGYLYLYIDNVFQEALTGLDTDTYDIDDARFGAPGWVDAGTSGSIYMDDCQWEGVGKHFAQPAGAITPAGAVAKKGKKPLAGAITPAGVVLAKAMKALAGAITPAGAVAKKAKRALAGAITFAGAITKKAKRALAGAITFVGTLAQYKLWIFFARFRDYFLTAPQRFTISSNKVQMTARYRDYYLTAPEKK